MYEALCESYSRATWCSQGGTRYAALTANTLRGRAGCSATVVVKCRAVQVPFAVEIFESKTEGVSDTLVFAFETPGGFWLVLCSRTIRSALLTNHTLRVCMPCLHAVRILP